MRSSRIAGRFSKVRAGALLVSAIGLLAACLAMIPVHIDGPLEQPVARFGVDPRKRDKACIEALYIQELPYSPTHHVWSVRSSNDRCRSLTQIVYGQAPSGFETVVPAAPLREGVRYYVRGSGTVGGLMRGVPWIGGGEYVFENGIWRSVAPPQS